MPLKYQMKIMHSALGSLKNTWLSTSVQKEQWIMHKH